LAKEAVGHYREAYDRGHPEIGAALTTLGRILVELNKLAEAQPALEEALEIFSVYGEDSPAYASANSALARAWALQGRNADAEPRLRHSYTVLYGTRGPDNEATVRVREWIIQLYAALGRTEDAAAFFENVANEAKRH
jgi:hypothetical protein